MPVNIYVTTATTTINNNNNCLLLLLLQLLWDAAAYIATETKRKKGKRNTNIINKSLYQIKM